RKWQEEGIDFRLLKGIEVDILPDGRLDYPDEVLASFDFVIASVHSGFKQDEKLMTRRLLRALEHPAVTMLGHPTGRLLLARPGYQVDLEEILQAASRYGKAIELNANPYRLDLDWRWCRRARELGVKIAINPDAHRREELGYVLYGVNIARKGWLTAKDVLNSQIPPWKS
ncbi:MAG: PHP domain-containing protein, partial [Bacillota bacterium]